MDNNSKKNPGNLAPTIRDVLFIIAIYLYFSGWLYAYYFFDHFGISLHVVDFPFHYFFVYSYSALWNLSNLLSILLTFGVIFLFINIIRILLARIAGQQVTFAVTFRFAAFWRQRWIITLLLVILLPTLFYLSLSEAENRALQMWNGRAKTVIFTFTDNANINRSLSLLNESEQLKLLTQTTENYMVLSQTQLPEQQRRVYVIPRRYVASALIEIRNSR